MGFGTVRVLGPFAVSNSKRIVLVAVGVLIIGGIDCMADHLAVFPNGFSVDVHRSVMIFAFANRFYLKPAGAGGCIGIQTSHFVDSGNVDGIVIVAVLDIQHTFVGCGGNYSAVLEINNYIIPGVRVTININNLTEFRVKCAVFERVFLTGIGPQRIISIRYTRCLRTGGVENDIFKCSRFIAPVVRTPIENAIFQGDMIDIRQSLCIIRLS